MSAQDPHFRLRVPADLKALIEDAAAKGRRTLNAEIVERLDRSFEASKLDLILERLDRIEAAIREGK